MLTPSYSLHHCVRNDLRGKVITRETQRVFITLSGKQTGRLDTGVHILRKRKPNWQNWKISLTTTNCVWDSAREQTSQEHVALFLLPVVTFCCSRSLQTITCIITSASLFFFLSVARPRAAPGRWGLHRCFSFPTLGLYCSCVWARPPALGSRGASARWREQHWRRPSVRGQSSAPLSGWLAHQNSAFMSRKKGLWLLADGLMLLSSAPWRMIFRCNTDSVLLLDFKNKNISCSYNYFNLLGSLVNCCWAS